MLLTTEQELMASAIRDHINGKTDKQTLVCHGVAGTGKTTVATALANEFPDAKLCAYTGKAASVLRTKSGLKACTVHSLFYKLIDKGIDEKTKKRILYFQRIHAEGGMAGKVILLDECSMIDRKTANDLLQSGAKIIAVGDPGQLPPVHGAQFFSQADMTLQRSTVRHSTHRSCGKRTRCGRLAAMRRTATSSRWFARRPMSR